MPSYKSFELVITLTEPMLGTVPKNKEVYAGFIATRAAKRKAGEEADIDDPDIMDEVNTVPVDENRGWTGFHTDDEGLFIFDYMVKGTIKEAGNVLKGDPEVKIAALKSKLDSYLFVYPRRLHMCTPDRVLIAKPDGVFERPLRAMTMQGPRVTLVRSDQVNAGTIIKCELRLLHHPDINVDTLRYLLDYGEFQGLGQFRNGSFGRFTYTLRERTPAELAQRQPVK